MRKNVNPLFIVGIVLAALAAMIFFGPRPELGPVPKLPDFSGMGLTDLQKRLETQESNVEGLRPDAHKLLIWAHPESPQKTDWALVFFHGYAASRREFDPVLQNVASRLGANVFLTRFAGHGFVGPDGHRGIKASQWLADCAEAVAIGHAIGKRLIIVGSSTGATLALWASAQQGWSVDGLVLVSPNFGPKDPRAGLLEWPWSFLLVKLLIGDYRSFARHNDRHHEAWDLTHHSDSLLPMAAVVKAARELDPARVRTPLLVLYHPEDPAIDHRITVALFQQWASPIKLLQESRLQPPNSLHVLAGDILSPGGSEILEDLILEFVDTIAREAAAP